MKNSVFIHNNRNIYLKVGEGSFNRTIPGEGMILYDLDKNGNLLGIEILSNEKVPFKTSKQKTKRTK